MEKTLEQEFEERKAIHKYAILTAKLMKYYRDLDTDNLIPDFMREEEYEKKAREDVKAIFNYDNGKLFNRFYELAWKEVKEILP